MAAYMGLLGLFEGAFYSVDNQTISDFIKETNFFINCNLCYLNFYISSKPWFYTFFFTISYLLLLLSISWFYIYNNFVALNSVLYADMLLRNCSPHPVGEEYSGPLWLRGWCVYCSLHSEWTDLLCLCQCIREKDAWQVVESSWDSRSWPWTASTQGHKGELDNSHKCLEWCLVIMHACGQLKLAAVASNCSVLTVSPNILFYILYIRYFIIIQWQKACNNSNTRYHASK